MSLSLLVGTIVLGHDLQTSVNDRVIWTFHKGFSLTKLRKFRENKTIAKISKFTVIIFDKHVVQSL